jgi:hypothetical protein
VTPSDDLALTADALVDLLEDPERLSTFRREAARTDVSNWAVETMCNKISDIYQRVAGSERNPSSNRWLSARRDQKPLPISAEARALADAARQRSN